MADRRRLGSLAGTPDLDRWIEIRGDGTVVVRSGKVELGQGIRTALTAIAADELGVHPDRILVTGAATGEAPNEGVTAGSGSIEQSGAAVRQACAHARSLLLVRAAEALGVVVEGLVVDDGVVRAPDGRAVSYAELGAGRPFGVAVDDVAETLPIGDRRWIGVGVPRVDLPAKVRGEPVFVHDLRLPGTRHARVVRPPRLGATLGDLTTDPSWTFEVVRRADFLAVVADREADAVAAAESVARAAQWEGGTEVDPTLDTVDHLRGHVRSSTSIVEGSAVIDDPPPPLDHAAAGATRTLHATYTKPFHLHGSIGPSAAVAVFEDGRLSVWSHSQGVELLRYSLGEAVGLSPDDVVVRHVDGAGCYGHNGADDAALDAAIVAVARPGVPIALTWSRDDEHGWEPLSPAMALDLSAGLDGGGRIVTWDHDVYSYPHGARPRPTGNPTVSGLLAAWHLEDRAVLPEPSPPRGFHSGAHRNADPLYDIPVRRVVSHLVDGPVRTSSTRGLGAFGNVFAIESFVDELAHAAGADPAAFRLAHLADPRARAVVEAAMEAAGGLDAPGGVDAPGRGMAFARYENHKTYVCVVVEVEVVARTGEVRLRHAWIAADAGEIIDPDGLTNQLEGGLVQAASWALVERVEVGAQGVASRDWASYPILRFSEVPKITTVLLDRPGRRSLGAGEATTGPTPAAIANAVFQATGARIRDLPLRPERVRAALAALL